MVQSRRAFTIVELLLVMVVLGILVTIALPRIDIQRFRVNGAVQALGTTMLTAQRQAVTEQHDVIVYFDTTGKLLRIHSDADNDGVIDTGEHTRPVRLGEGIVFGRGPATAFAGAGSNAVNVTKVLNGYQAVVFHRDGSASEAASFYITSVTAQRGNTRPQDARALVVERATGRSQWWRFTGSGGSWVKLF
ncbi:MAG TPA: prepilin-type N-terminal cleavage/methylation domain-containing protein [Gemmatimonadaceae bacterium]|nr:prepilin-type N-terminal cleavage/methylation domain-containing protein [Gemmatimonadaceae bacterium]